MAGKLRPPETTMKTIVTRAFFLKGERQDVGTELDVDDHLARELIHNGKVKKAESAAKPVADNSRKPREKA